MPDFINYLRSRFKEESTVDQSLTDFFLSKDKAIIYGAGLQARIILDCARFFQKPVECLLIADDGYRNMESFYDHIPLHHIGNLPEDLDKIRKLS